MQKYINNVCARALVEVNKARAALGSLPISELPKGRFATPDQCPIARGLGHNALVDHTAIYFIGNPTFAQKVAEAWGTKSEGESAPLPDVLRDFLAAFDGEKIPDLIERWG